MVDDVIQDKTKLQILVKILEHSISRYESNGCSVTPQNDTLFDNIVNCVRDVTYDENIEFKSSMQTKLVLLRHLMLAQRWEKAVPVLSSLFSDIGRVAPSHFQLFKVALELRFQLGCFSGNLDALVKSAISVCTYDSLTIEIDRFLHDAAIKFEEGIVVGSQNSSSCLQDMAVNLRNARRSKTGRKRRHVEVARCTHLEKWYTGTLAYVQAILAAGELAKLNDVDSRDKEQGEDMQETFANLKLQDDMKTCVQIADNYFLEALRLCPTGPWDSFISMHVDLVRRFRNEFDEDVSKTLLRNILETFCSENPLNKNGLKLLAEYYVEQRLNQDCDAADDDSKAIDDDSKAIDDDRAIEVFERIVMLDQFDETCLMMVQSQINRTPSLIYLFKMLDGFVWKNSEEVWFLLAKELLRLLSSTSEEDLHLVRTEWNSRHSWWPKYHFKRKENTLAAIHFLEGAVCCLLEGRNHPYFEALWTERQKCPNTDCANILIMAFNLNIRIQCEPVVWPKTDESEFEFKCYVHG